MHQVQINWQMSVRSIIEERDEGMRAQTIIQSQIPKAHVNRVPNFLWVMMGI